MSGFVRQLMMLCGKDLIMEFRELRHFISVVLFGLLLLLLFSFALSVDPELVRKIAPGIFWLAIFFASTLTLDHSFRREHEDGEANGLLMMGADPRAFYLAKMLANLSFLLVLEGLLLLLMAILFDLEPNRSLVLVLLLGSLGLASLGTFYAGLTASLKEGQVLLPLLLFPMLVPVLLAAVHATELTLVHDVFGQRVAWFKLLIVFDFIFLVGSLLCADFLFEGS